MPPRTPRRHSGLFICLQVFVTGTIAMITLERQFSFLKATQRKD
jgi:hypothetical protein